MSNDEKKVHTVFLSCVSTEFKKQRIALTKMLAPRRLKPIVQEDFPKSSGLTLLRWIHDEVQRCAVMVHLIGRRAGYDNDDFTEWGKPTKNELDEVLPLIAGKLADPKPRWEDLSYTQWEAWLGLCYGVRMFAYDLSKKTLACEPQDPSVLTQEQLLTERHRISQRNHLGLLQKHGIHVGSIAPSKIRIQVGDDLSNFIIEQKLRDRKHADDVSRLQVIFQSKSARDVSESVMRGRKQLDAGFYGRTWLRDHIGRWIRDRHEPVFWLEADAGFGKSRFCSQLVLPWQDFDKLDAAVTLFLDPNYGPLKILAAICGQLITSSPEYHREFNAAWELIPWQELTIPAELGVAGEEQEELAERLIEPLLLEPLRREANSRTATDAMIVIDGLDELLQWHGGTTLFPMEKLLERLLSAKLPNYRLLVTSRPARMYPQLRNLIETKHPRRCVPSQRDMEQDAGKFIIGELGMISQEWCAAAVVQQLVEKSKASMLYLFYMTSEIRAKNLAPHDIKDFPEGMSTYYLEKMNEYFPPGEVETNYVGLVRPCLELIAAGERTDLSAKDVEACLGKRSIEALHHSLHAMIFIVKRPKMIDGQPTEVFAPFHLSFLDWLLGRPFDEDSSEGQPAEDDHRFLVSCNEGHRRLADWAWTEYLKRKDESGSVAIDCQYWARQGTFHLLMTFQDGFDKEGRKERDGKRYEHYDYLVRAVTFLDWLNQRGHRDLVVSARPLLAQAINQTLEDDSAEALKSLQPVNQFALFRLFSEACATEVTEQVIYWIGRTQHALWDELVTQILKLDEFVIRYAAASGQAARYQRLVKEGAQAEAAAEIDGLLRSDDLNRQEMGAYAVGQLAKEMIPERIKNNDHVAAWLRAESAADRYFCQSTLGDLMINLSFREFDRQVNYLDRHDIVPAFWEPIWQYTELDVINVHAQRKHRKQPACRGSEKYEAEIEVEVRALKCREDAIAVAVQSGDLTEHIGELLQKVELDDSDFNDVVDWITREDVTGDARIRTTMIFLELIFAHPLWSVCEQGAAILELAAAKPGFRNFCLSILDALLTKLENPDSVDGLTRWRVLLGTCEASYLLRHQDKTQEFPGYGKLTRFDFCCRRFFDNDFAPVRGLLIEDFAFIAIESRATEGFLPLLEGLTIPIDRWLIDDDIWVLEHVYQLFRVVHDEQKKDGMLEEWVQERDQSVAKHVNSLLGLLVAKVQAPWYTLNRTDFLDNLQAIRRQQLKDRSATET